MIDRLPHWLCAAVALALVVAGGESLAQKRGGAMNIILQPEPPVLVLAINQQGPTQTVAGKIYQGLLTYDFDLKPMPGLAKSWTVSPDGLTYTFKLQDNVKWHDGKPFTSADVVFTTKVMLPETHPRARANFGRTASIEAPDTQTVVFKLKEPFAPFLWAFELSSAPMMPKHIYEGTDFRNNPANQAPIGTGPFKFKVWEKGSHIHLVRNDAYWKPGLPYLDEIFFRILPDAASRALALETGQAHQSQFDGIENLDVKRLKGLPHLEVTTKGYEFFAPLSWIEFNVREAPLNDKRFRKAVMHAIDRNFIRDNIWHGLGRIATGPINSVTRFYDGNVTKYNYDPRKAEALLDEMGLKKGADGKRAKVSILLLPYGEAWVRLAEYVRQSLIRIGVDAVIESVDAATWAKRAGNWEYQITFNFLYQFSDPALGVSRSYISSNIRKGVLFTNTMGYSNPRVDELFAKAAQTNNEAEAKKLYTEVQQILADEVPVAWLLELEFPTIYNKKFKNAITTGIGANESYDGVWME